MNPPDGRSQIALAWGWASRIMTISMEMVLPGLAGYWLDEKLGTKALLMLIGFVLGCTAAVVHLVHLAREPNRRGKNKISSKENSEENQKDNHP